MQARIPQQHALKYILGGKANVVFFNTKTGNQRKYQIMEWRGNPGNYTIYSGEYGAPKIGRITAGSFYPQTSLDKEHANLIESFGYMFYKIILQQVPDYIHILHFGRCSVCGRKLTDAESIERGVGPKCAGL